MLIMYTYIYIYIYIHTQCTIWGPDQAMLILANRTDVAVTGHGAQSPFDICRYMAFMPKTSSNLLNRPHMFEQKVAPPPPPGSAAILTECTLPLARLCDLPNSAAAPVFWGLEFRAYGLGF